MNKINDGVRGIRNVSLSAEAGTPNGGEHKHAELDDEQIDAALLELPQLANQIVDTAIDGVSRKLIAGYRNKKNANPNSGSVDFPSEAREALKSATADSVVAVASRGQAWKEMVEKTLTRGIGSLSTTEFDGEFNVRDGKVEGGPGRLMPRSPGVYVVFDSTGKAVYIGDSENMQARWTSGHLNAFREGEREGRVPYKLADELRSGCTVRYIETESKETAAAIEAHFIRESIENGANNTLKNKRNELESEQGTRSNQEAKKLKDASGTVGSLALGAGKEAAAHVGSDVLHTLSTSMIKAIKNELVDVMRGGRAALIVRVERVIQRLARAVRGIDLWGILRGLVEFIVNALSKAIGQVMNLARNVWDLGNATFQLYKGAQLMSREDLVRKVAATIITSGSLVVWEAVDPLIEAKLAAVIGPFAPYLSAVFVAIGFGLSSYLLNDFVRSSIDAIVAFKQGYLESLDASRESCDQLVRIAETELRLIAVTSEYVDSSLEFQGTLVRGISKLSAHNVLEPLDFNELTKGLS